MDLRLFYFRVTIYRWQKMFYITLDKKKLIKVKQKKEKSYICLKV